MWPWMSRKTQRSKRAIFSLLLPLFLFLSSYAWEIPVSCAIKSYGFFFLRTSSASASIDPFVVNNCWGGVVKWIFLPTLHLWWNVRGVFWKLICLEGTDRCAASEYDFVDLFEWVCFTILMFSLEYLCESPFRSYRTCADNRDAGCLGKTLPFLPLTSKWQIMT